MYKLKLIKIRSYSGVVKVSQADPYVYISDENEAQTLISTGYFELCDEAEDTADVETVSGADAESVPDYNALADMTKSELVKYAEGNGIDVEGCRTKADLLKAISVAAGGSSTMIDLQN